MPRQVFQVPQIHCQGCERTITAALGDVDGIDLVEPDQASDTVTVGFDGSRIGADRIAELLADAGFAVEHVTDEMPVPGRGAEPSADVDAGQVPETVPGRPGPGARYGGLAAAVLTVALVGYAGYVVYPRFDLPAVEGAGLLALAAAAGIASFFSPCSFPLLLSLLGRQPGRHDAGKAAPPMLFGGALAVGAATFMILAGVVIGLGGEALFAGVTFASPAGIAIRSIVGTLLIVLGLAQIGRLALPMGRVEHLTRPITRWQARVRRRHPVAGFGLFGFSYVLAGFG